MGPIDYARVRQLYDAAIEKSADQRADLLEVACSDPAIRREVKSLLAVASRAVGFLSQAPMLQGMELPTAYDASSCPPALVKTSRRHGYLGPRCAAVRFC